MQDVVKGISDAASLLTGLDGMFSATRKKRPEWVSLAFVSQVETEYRRLAAVWQATPWYSRTVLALAGNGDIFAATGAGTDVAAIARNRGGELVGIDPAIGGGLCKFP